jgi:ribosomal protein S12 methylthiotransferase
VLIEGKTDKTDFPFYGRTRFQAPEIDGITYVRARKLAAGDIVRCKITAAEIYDLYAGAIRRLRRAVEIRYQ